MTDGEFRRIARYIENKAGIHLDEKRVLVEGRLDYYITKKGYDNYSEYMNAVESDITGRLAEELINMLTTNHTYFMREYEHFDFFYKVVLPELKAAKSGTKDLRIWCAASSTGEEPYTLAMIIRDSLGLEANKWDTQLLATDISTEVLKTAIRGIYPAKDIKPVPENWKRRYFRQVDKDHVEVTKEIKEQILFRQFNLMSPLPFRQPLQVIFMRNVMIYFDKEHKNQLLQRVYDCMEPGGYLFVGATEAIDRKIVPFQYVQPSVYRK